MEQLFDLLIELGKVLLALLAIGAASRQGTELIKNFWNMLVVKFPFLSLHDKRSFILAAAVAFAIAYGFGVDITQFMSILDGFDPELLKLVNYLLLTLISNQVHNALPKPEAG